MFVRKINNQMRVKNKNTSAIYLNSVKGNKNPSPGKVIEQARNRIAGVNKQTRNSAFYQRGRSLDEHFVQNSRLSNVINNIDVKKKI